MLTKIGDNYVDIDSIVVIGNVKNNNSKTAVVFVGSSANVIFDVPPETFIAAIEAAGLIETAESEKELAVTQQQSGLLLDLYYRGFRYLATDKIGVTRAYTSMPVVDGAYWCEREIGNPKCVRVNEDLPFTFEDGAVPIADLLDGVD